MKKLLLLLSFLASQLLAVECTQEQYKPYFDKNNDRYMTSAWQQHDLSPITVDKKSIVYDKENQKIVCWLFGQVKNLPNYGIVKMEREFNINTKQTRLLSTIILDCEGYTLGQSSQGELESISPESVNEVVFNSIKKYLNIK